MAFITCCGRTPRSRSPWKQMFHVCCSRKGGPRVCNHLFFLMLFVVFLSGWVLISMFAWRNSDYERIINEPSVTDSFGNICGSDNKELETSSNLQAQSTMPGRDKTSKPFLFPLDISDPGSTVWICVEQCPNVTYTSESEDELRSAKLCVDEGDLTTSSYTTEKNITELCATVPVLPSKPVLHRCFPTAAKLNVVRGILQTHSTIHDLARQLLSDIRFMSMGTYTILGAAGVGNIVLCIAIVVLLRFIRPVIFCVIQAVVLFFWLYFPFEYLSEYTEDMRDAEKWSVMGNESSLGVDLGGILNPRTAGISCMVILYILCGYSCYRGKNTARVLNMAAIRIFEMPILLIQPILVSTLLILLFGYSLFTLLLLSSLEEPSVSQQFSSSAEQTYFFLPPRLLIIYHIFGFIWMFNFITFVQRHITAATIVYGHFSKIKFEHKVGTVKRWTLIGEASIQVLANGHGQAALAGLITSLVPLPRFVVRYAYAWLKHHSDGHSYSSHRKLRSLAEEVDKLYVNSNSNPIRPIPCAADFYDCSTFGEMNKKEILTWKNIQPQFVQASAYFYLVYLQAVIASLTATYVYSSLRNDPEVYHPWFPALLTLIASYIMANCLLSVYDTTICQLRLCVMCFEEKDVRDSERDDAILRGKLLVEAYEVRNAMISRIQAEVREEMNRPTQTCTDRSDFETLPMLETAGARAIRRYARICSSTFHVHAENVDRYTCAGRPKSLRFELWDSDFFPGYDDDLIVVQECIYPYRCILRGGYDDGLWDYNQEFYIKIRIECHNQTRRYERCAYLHVDDINHILDPGLHGEHNVRLDMLQNVYFLDQLDNRNPITLCPDGAKLKKEKKIY